MSEVLTANESSIGSSGGTTIVRIIMQLSRSLDLARFSSHQPVTIKEKEGKKRRPVSKDSRNEKNSRRKSTVIENIACGNDCKTAKKEIAEGRRKGIREESRKGELPAKKRRKTINSRVCLLLTVILSWL
jgi:hypothetical protein